MIHLQQEQSHLVYHDRVESIESKNAPNNCYSIDAQEACPLVNGVFFTNHTWTAATPVQLLVFGGSECLRPDRVCAVWA